ncbi:hypothetical protein Tco_0750724 [Tanacetum coccineum]|uniref:Uncharacterized protein n=1 Tax=Tanacetum coccineum TaxID=301880 RepID=A0ABQ4Z5F4_9ASTR
MEGGTTTGTVNGGELDMDDEDKATGTGFIGRGGWREGREFWAVNRRSEVGGGVEYGLCSERDEYWCILIGLAVVDFFFWIAGGISLECEARIEGSGKVGRVWWEDRVVALGCEGLSVFGGV